MFPAAFDYIRAHSAEEALAALAQHGAEARILAGGQSLIPAMRLRLARPAVLVDLGGVKDLGYLREEGGELRVGAMTRDVTLERDANVRARYSLLTDTGAVVADPFSHTPDLVHMLRERADRIRTADAAPHGVRPSLTARLRRTRKLAA